MLYTKMRITYCKVGCEFFQLIPIEDLINIVFFIEHDMLHILLMHRQMDDVGDVDMKLVLHKVPECLTCTDPVRVQVDLDFIFSTKHDGCMVWTLCNVLVDV